MKTTFVVLLLSLLGSVALAQSTPYSTNVFSATFVGPVTTDQTGTAGGTSTNLLYEASTSSVMQALAVRTISAPGIPVDQASLDVYAADSLKGGKTQDDRQYLTIQGHIAVYVNAHYVDEAGYLTRRRTLSIILSSRTVILFIQEAQASTDDGGAKSYETFFNSLVINEKTCWLPEGCN